MKSLVQGVHHITLCPGGAQQDIDFFTQVLGQRLVKQTVLMDGNIPIYHFYYGNADADVGSIATCFPYSRKPGRAGSGQLSCTSYTVPTGAIAFWKEHFDRHRAEHSGVQERFGTKYLRVRHPAGLLFEMIEESERHAESVDDDADPARRRRRAASSGPCCRCATCANRNRSSSTRSASRRSASTVPTIASKCREPVPDASSTCTSSRSARPAAGASAPARRITSRSTSRPTTRW